jgi:hypothetical protein
MADEMEHSLADTMVVLMACVWVY